MAGLPVVTTNVGSVSEIVLDGETGIVTGLEVNEIADAIERLCHEPELREKMGRLAQEFTTSRFGVQRLILDHENLYKHLLTNPAKS
jgi:glycosyltransferase involved in cell wall biosynthesis